jgi:glucose/arabinose dehydrogenase
MQDNVTKKHKIKNLITTCLTIFVSVSVWGENWPKIEYKKLPELCDGYPQLPIGTMPNSCVGLVIDQTNVDPATGKGMKFPRKIVQIPNSEDFIVTDMGSWNPQTGAVFRLVKQANGYALKTVFNKLNMPFDAEVGPEGHIYIGEMGRIFKFDPNLAAPTIENVITNLPTNLTVKNMHPLNSFAFLKNQNAWDIVVNVGSPTDNCGKEAPGVCRNSDGPDAQAALRKYKYLGDGKWNQTYSIFARGLRNSMALTVSPAGWVMQAENARALNSDVEPHEELNIVQEGRHYGFPYCYNFRAKVPEWSQNPNIDCASKAYDKPHVLLPPRVAPLDMTYYSGKMFPELQGHLLMTWHGYKPTGNRLVAFDVDQNGWPHLSNTPATYNVWDATRANGKKTVSYSAAGGVLRSAQHKEIITDWFSKRGLRPNGSIVGVTEASDGSIWVVADYNNTVLRIARSAEWHPTAEESRGDLEMNVNDLSAEDIERLKDNVLNDPENLRRWGYIRSGILQKHCTACHDMNPNKKTDQFAELEFLLSSKWITLGNYANSKLYNRMSQAETATPMPPSGLLGPQDRLTIQRFIERLK